MNEQNQTMKLLDESYKDYFEAFDSWKFYFMPDFLGISDIESHYSHKWKAVLTPKAIASNNLNKPLAIEFSAEFHEWIRDVDELKGSWHFRS